MLDLSIIIVSYNNLGILKDCLESIHKFTSKVNFEVIIVDNNSSEPGLREVVSLFDNLILIENEDNRGFSAANNQGVEIAKGKYILFLNNDTILVEDVFYKLIVFSDSSPDDNLIGIKLLNVDYSHQHSIVDFPNFWNTMTESLFLYTIFKRNKYFNKYWLNYFDHKKPLSVDIVMGAFILGKSTTIRRLGGFDERFYFYAEETDLCKRHSDAGGKIIFHPELKLIHIGGATATRISWFHFENQHRGKIQYAQKHFKGLKFLLFLFFHYLGLFIRIPIYFSLGILKFDKNYFLKAYYYLLQFISYPENKFLENQ